MINLFTFVAIFVHRYVKCHTAEFPEPINPPYIIAKYPTRLVISLNSQRFGGIGPITKRYVLFKPSRLLRFQTCNTSILNDTATINGLSPYTRYDVAVVLENSRFKGPRGPVTTMRTSCAIPTTAPFISSAFARTNSTLYITWRNPSPVETGGKIEAYEIRYRIVGFANQQWEVTRVRFPEARSSMIKKLKEQNVYEVKIRLHGCGGDSPFSKPVRITTGRLKKPPSPKVRISNVTSHSISILWEFPANAWVKTLICYEIQLYIVSSNVTIFYGNVTVPKYNFYQLPPYTSYCLQVRAFNHEGPGLLSDLYHITTKEDAPFQPKNARSLNITPHQVTLSWKPPSRSNGIIRSYDVAMMKDGYQWISVNISDVINHTTVVVKNLEEYTIYHFRVRGFTVRYGNWSNAITMRTMCSRPLHAPSFRRIFSTSPQSVTVTWHPPAFSPHVGDVIAYKIIFTDDVRQNDQHWRSKIIDAESTSTSIVGLRASTVYFFKIAAKSQEFGPFSEKATERTDKLGLPPPPFDTVIFNITSSSALVSWRVQSGYRITVVKVRFLSGGSIPDQLVDSLVHNQFILAPLRPNTKYRIEVVASNYVGDSSANPSLTFQTLPSVLLSNLQERVEDTFLFKMITGALTGLLLVTVIMATAIYCKCRLKSIQLSQASNASSSPSHVELDSVSAFLRASTIGSFSQRSPFISRSDTLLSCQSAHSSNSRAPSTHSNQIFAEQFILSWSDIFFEDISLGVGNFGQVVKATVRKENELLASAVKMLKDGCTLEDKREFLAELDLMSRIGFHRNVISLIGACEHDGFMYLCTEFAPNGNLLCYLRQSRKLECEAGCYTSISNNQLLLFASDIAEGMAYISDKQIIHRDLAARNILLGQNLVCKISDFGLSRGEGVYVKKTVARLPVRWMSIESLNYNVYTSKSDVWSYGVLLWEIVSLGGTPYFGMSCAELYDKLPAGYRLEKPLNCDDEFYILMHQCWKDRPYERPTFAQLAVAIERIRDARSTQSYVNTAILEGFRFANIDVTEEEG